MCALWTKRRSKAVRAKLARASAVNDEVNNLLLTLFASYSVIARDVLIDRSFILATAAQRNSVRHLHCALAPFVGNYKSLVTYPFIKTDGSSARGNFNDEISMLIVSSAVGIQCRNICVLQINVEDLQQHRIVSVFLFEFLNFEVMDLCEHFARCRNVKINISNKTYDICSSKLLGVYIYHSIMT